MKNILFKDANNRVHEIPEDHKPLLPPGLIEISQDEADILRTPSPLTTQEIEAEKDKQVEADFSAPSLRAITETFLDIIKDGSVATKTANEVLLIAKSKRRAEL